ncbi:MAG: protein-tyrosine phosphatase family protein [Candidatus Hodarchaeales archaeon]|jgi:atypical dual specificity phosphatase
MKNTPFRFFWIIKNQLAGSNLPTSVDHIHRIAQSGIKRIISIASIDNVESLIQNSKNDLDHLKLAFKDFGIPDKQQIKRFLNFAQDSHEKNEPLLIHCYAGCGRTGVLLVIYLMFFEGLNSISALQRIRKIRKCAVESKIQQEFLHKMDLKHL